MKTTPTPCTLPTRSGFRVSARPVPMHTVSVRTADTAPAGMTQQLRTETQATAHVAKTVCIPPK